MHRIILSSVSCPALKYFFTLSHKWHNFKGKKKSYCTQNVCWFSLQLLFETFLILRRNERNVIKNVFWSSRKVPLFLWDFNDTWIFWQVFFLKISNTKFHENPFSWSQTDGETWRNSESLFTVLKTHLKIQNHLCWSLQELCWCSYMPAVRVTKWQKGIRKTQCGQRRCLIALPSSASPYTPCCIRKRLLGWNSKLRFAFLHFWRGFPWVWSTT